MKWKTNTIQSIIILVLVICWLKALFFSPVVNRQEAKINQDAVPVLQQSNSIFLENLQRLNYSILDYINERHRVDDLSLGLAIDSIQNELTRVNISLAKAFLNSNSITKALD